MAVESNRYARRLYRTRVCVGRCAPHSAQARPRTAWARGAWRQDAYNARGLVSGTTYSDAATPSVAYGYADSGKVSSATLSDGSSFSYGYDDRLLNTNESVTVGGEAFSVSRTYDGFRRALEAVSVVAGVRHSAKVRRYASEDRVCGYALANAACRGVSVVFAYDGSHVTNVAYAMPNGSVFSVNLTRERARKELVTRRDCLFGGRPVYWYETGYDLLGRPTNAADSVSLAREWLYNRHIVVEKVEFSDGTARTFEYFWGMDKSGTEQSAGGGGGLLAVSVDGAFYIPCYDHNGNIVRRLRHVAGRWGNRRPSVDTTRTGARTIRSTCTTAQSGSIVPSSTTGASRALVPSPPRSTRRRGKSGIFHCAEAQSGSLGGLGGNVGCRGGLLCVKLL